MYFLYCVLLAASVHFIVIFKTVKKISTKQFVLQTECDKRINNSTGEES